eukprot:TRINITY_DN19421_c0_g1_i1.p1 TRINITY_DN19421_c0_g1~~TRINITY_DN19421_c0_g1_i1.p1  ORF type:complete len:273 (-),score=56.29 TRINITY_DN19421_c0_g1_i1:124-942(-)
MASSLSAASSAAPITEVSLLRHFRHAKFSFRLSTKPKLLFSAKGLRSNWKHSAVPKAKLNEVSLASTIPAIKSELSESEEKNTKSTNKPSSFASASEESIAAFMTQVASLVKLVDSRDIVELQLKQLDCELIIRKKEALPQPPAPAMMNPPTQPVAMQSHFPPAPPTTAPTPAVPTPPLTTAAPSAAAKSAKSSISPLKCPMAGTFYRCAGPGEPPFVKVGDKVKKGQVLCIIEAMKLMNEIEADQSGTVVEILVDDGKLVSMDTPLFVIEP